MNRPTDRRTWPIVAAVLLFAVSTRATSRSASGLAADKPTADQESAERAEPPRSRGPAPPSGATIVNEGQRPGWIGRRPYREGRNFYIWVSGQMASTKNKARRLLDDAMHDQAVRYAESYVNHGRGLEFITPDYVTAMLEAETFVDEIQSPTFGTMYQAHGLLRMRPEFFSKLDKVKREAEQGERVLFTSMLSGGVVVVMAGAAFWLTRRYPAPMGTPWSSTHQVVEHRGGQA